jgi:hypothetical protein
MILYNASIRNGISGLDSYRELALKTRLEFLTRYADQPVLVFATHLATPSAGHIVKHGAGWRFRV